MKDWARALYYYYMAWQNRLLDMGIIVSPTLFLLGVRGRGKGKEKEKGNGNGNGKGGGGWGGLNRSTFEGHGKSLLQ